MRSQVQVLAGPPPIVAAHSAAGSEPGAVAVGLGRAGAARPSPPAPPVAPPGPPPRPSGSATTTHRGRAPSPRTPATPRLPPPPRCSLLPCPPRRPRDGLRTPAWPAWSLSGQAWPPRPAPNPAARVRHRPPSDQPDVGSVARPGLLDRRRAVDGSAATGAATGSGGHGRPASSTWPPTPPPEHGRRTRPDRRGRHQTAGHRTGGQQPAGHQTAGQQPSDRRTSGRRPSGDRTPDGWTAGPGRRDRMGGHRCWTPATDAVAWLLAGSTTATTPDLARPAGRCCGQTPSGRAPTRTAQRQHQPGPLSGKDAGGTHAARDGPGHRRDVSCRWYAAVQLAPWRTAVLGRLRVERRARRGLSSVMTIADESAVVGSCATVREGAA
jgi:hypothetical protein